MFFILCAPNEVSKGIKCQVLTLTNSLNEIETFVESIEKILDDLTKVESQTNENISRVIYYKTSFRFFLQNLFTKSLDSF